MAEHSSIEWTDATWNPITGCSILSPGCAHCYAMKLAGTRLRNHPSRAGLTQASKAGPVWTGEVRFNEQWLTQPLGWSRPRNIFVCAHGDLFHESVPGAWIDQVFAVMALSPRHTFQVLTKRAQRMQAYLSDRLQHNRMELAAEKVRPAQGTPVAPKHILPWVLPNVWLGISAERQQEADERIPLLLATPAAKRFISAEPLLGPINLTSINHRGVVGGHSALLDRGLGSLDWVIAGGESGDGARPMHPAWPRAIARQCAAACVPFHFKQWGVWAPAEEPASETQEDEELRNAGVMLDGQYMRRVGKKRAGRLLDGIEHNGMPARGAA